MSFLTMAQYRKYLYYKGIPVAAINWYAIWKNTP